MTYLNRSFLILLFVMFAVASSGYALAQDAGDKAPAADSAQSNDKVIEKLRNNNPYLDKLHNESVEFIKDVPEEGVKVLYLIRQAYGIVRSVYQVRTDVKNAVDLCGEANADLKADMDSRFAEWDKQVGDALSEQDKRLNETIKKQSYKDEKVVHDYLKNIDDAADYANKMLDKHVVTTPEACTSLRDSMAKTGPNIVTLLGQINMPELNDDGTAVVEDAEGPKDAE